MSISGFLKFMGADIMGDVGADSAAMGARKLFTDKLAGSSLTDAQQTTARNAFESSMNEGQMLSAGGIDAMLRNVEAGVAPRTGLSAQTTTGTGATNFLGGQSGGILGAMGAGAMLGVGGATISGSDKTEGAMYGAMAGLTVGGAARGIMQNIGDIEKGFMKDLLGSKYTASNVDKTFNTGSLVKDLDPSFKLSDLGINSKKHSTVGEYLGSLKAPQKSKMKTKKDFTATIYARSENLNTLTNMDTSGLGTIDSYKRDLLLGTKKLNVGQMGRMATGAGAFLGGMAFASSNRKDYRRGFNKGRGNRI
jgi:hypothetical protein